MEMKLIIAIISITLALVFYTVGVFSQRKSNTLKKWHVITFWCGLLFDITGTLIMQRIASESNIQIPQVQAMIHGITGALAIILMIFNATWATYILYKNDEKKKKTFNRLSITIWAIWLVPYLIGMIIGMTK